MSGLSCEEWERAGDVGKDGEFGRVLRKWSTEHGYGFLSAHRLISGKAIILQLCSSNLDPSVFVLIKDDDIERLSAYARETKP